MAVVSAGILLYRRTSGRTEVFLVHPGGPIWARKEEHAWSIPKGIVHEGEDPPAAAQREFFEETSFTVTGEMRELTAVRLSSGKIVLAWAVEGEAEAADIRSNTFEMEWPPKSGRMQAFPEVDRAGWFAIDEARNKMFAGQIPLLDQLETMLAG